jgi:hypothetical protein
MVAAPAVRADDAADTAKARASELRRQHAVHQPTMAARSDARQAPCASRADTSRADRSWYGPDQFGYAPWRGDARRTDVRRDVAAHNGMRSDLAFDSPRRIEQPREDRMPTSRREEQREFDRPSARPWSAGYGHYEEWEADRSSPMHHGAMARDDRFDSDRYAPWRGEREWTGHASLPRSSSLEEVNHDLWGHISILEREIEHLRAHVAALEDSRAHAGGYGAGRADRRQYGPSPHDMW